MEDILELLCTIITIPFKGKYDDLYAKINHTENKFLRILFKVLIILVPLIFIFALCSLCSFFIREYWI